jgi:DNA-binding NarL/FixJ family response regulator
VIRPCVEAGAHGYMLKSERGFDITSAIKELWKTDHYFSPEVRKSLSESRNDTAVETITEREKEIIQALFEGMSTKEMAEKFFISSHTVETHRRNLMGKLEAKNRQHLVYLAIKNGIISV